MRRLHAIPLLLVLGGCSFDLSRPPPDSRTRPDLALLDLPLDRAPLTPDLRIDQTVPDLPCAPKVEILDVEADTVLITNDNLAKGTLTAGNIGSELKSCGLFRFTLPPAATNLRGLRLRLSPVENDDNCGPPKCKSCASIQKTGDLDLHYMISSWEEATAAWEEKDSSAPWEVDGAAGSKDRSAKVGTASFVLGKEVQFEIKTDLLDLVASWRDSGKLSFLVAPHQGTVLVAAMREQQQAGGCKPAKPPPRLEVTYCP